MDFLVQVLVVVVGLAIIAIPILGISSAGLALFNNGAKNIMEAREARDASIKCIICGAKGTVDVRLAGGKTYVLCDNPACAASPRLAPLKASEIGRFDKSSGRPIPERGNRPPAAAGRGTSEGSVISGPSMDPTRVSGDPRAGRDATPIVPSRKAAVLKFCPQCGSQLPGGRLRFCVNCGAELPTAAS